MNLKISNNNLFLLKMVGVLSMTIDHYNKSNGGANEIMFSMGRLALPIFVFVLAYNLARIPADAKGRVGLRLALFGAAATIPYNLLGWGFVGGWWPLNVLFLLSGISLFLWAYEKAIAGQKLYGFAAAFIALLTCLLPEFWFFGLGLGIAVYAFFSLGENKSGRKLVAVACGMVALSSLYYVNGNFWALAAIPTVLLIGCLPKTKFNLPRLKWFFYYYYPLHLTVLWAIKNQL